MPVNPLAPDIGLGAVSPDVGLNPLADPNAPAPPGPFKRGLLTGVADTKSIAGGVLEYAGRGFGAKPLENYGKAMGEAAAAESAPYRMQVEDVGKAFDQGILPGLGATADLIKYSVGNQLPMMATAALGGIAGRLGATALGATRALAGVSAGEKAAAVARTAAGVGSAGDVAISSALKAADLGAEAGVLGSSTAMELGQIAPEGLKPENNASMAQMALGALVSGATDTILPVLLARKIGLIGAAERVLTPRPAGMAGYGAIAKDVGATALKAGGFEAGQEGLQTYIERASANQALTGPEANSDALNSSVMGGILGLLTGGFAGGIHGMTRPLVQNPPPSTLREQPLEVNTPEQPPAMPPVAAPSLAETPPASIQGDIMAQGIAAQQAVMAADQKVATLQAAIEPLGARVPKAMRSAYEGAVAEQKSAHAAMDTLSQQDYRLREQQPTVPAETPLPEIGAPEAPVLPAANPAPDTSPVLKSAVTPAVRTDQPAPVIIGGQPVAVEHATEEAVKAVHAMFRDQGMPLATTRESLATPPQTPREVALAKVEQRTPLSSEKQAPIADQVAAREDRGITASQEAVSAIVGAKVESSRKTYTPAEQAKLTRTLTDAVNSVVQEAAVLPSLEERQAAIKTGVAKVMARQVDAGSAQEVAESVAKTMYSKGAVEPTPRVQVKESLIKEQTSQEKKAGHASSFKNPVTLADGSHLSGFSDPVTRTTFHGYTANGERFTIRAADVKPETLVSSRDSNRTVEAVRQAVVDHQAKLQPLDSRAALSQTEYDNLPTDAQNAAMDAYNQVLRTKGTELRNHLTQLVGNRPELVVKTFQANPDSPIGTYTRVDAYKAVIALAVNAKEGLSLADHEGFHFAEDWLLTPAERQIVGNALKEGRPLLNKLLERVQRYDRENKTNLADEVAGTPAEARAYAFQFWRAGELRAEGALQRVFEKIRNFLDKIVNLTKGLGFQSIEDIFAALDHGQFQERATQANEGVGGLVLSSRAEQATWYRSALTDAVTALPTKAASAQGWKDQIKGLVGKKDVKQVEIDAVGLNEFLDLQQGKITRDQVVSFLKENGVQVKETVLGAEKDLSLTEASVIIANGGEIYAIPKRYPDQTARATLDDNKTILPHIWAHPDQYILREGNENDAHTLKIGTRFNRPDLLLPGGQNYRELLLTLPGGNELNVQWERLYDQLQENKDPRAHDEIMRQINIVTDKLNNRKQNEFKSSHFDQPNILAHIRFNERTDASGARVLFIEEIQSDFGQTIKRNRDAVVKYVDDAFETVVARMQDAGVLEVNCD